MEAVFKEHGKYEALASRLESTATKRMIGLLNRRTVTLNRKAARALDNGDQEMVAAYLERGTTTKWMGLVLKELAGINDNLAAANAASTSKAGADSAHEGAQTPDQPNEASPPRRPDAYNNLLRVAEMLRETGAEIHKQGHTVVGVDYCERAALAEFKAELLDELGVIGSSLVGIETRLDQLAEGRGL